MKRNPFRMLLSFLAASLLAASAANAAFTLVASDPIEAFADYTITGSSWQNTGAHNTFRDLTAFDLTAGTDLFLYGSNGTDSGMDSTYRHTAGFGGTVLVQAGTYQITAYSGVGNLSPGRQAFQTFDVMLMTVPGVEWSGGGIIETLITP